VKRKLHQFHSDFGNRPNVGHLDQAANMGRLLTSVLLAIATRDKVLPPLLDVLLRRPASLIYPPLRGRVDV
jgi:hypothetical protein